MSTPYCHIPRGTPVLVTGATGFTGSHLVRQLTDAGLAVRAIARPSSNTAPLDNLPIEWIRGDVYDPDTVAAAAVDVRYIFHLATTYRQSSSSSDEFRRVHVASTQLLAEQAARTKGFERFVHVSTCGVHGHIEDGPANEQQPFAPGDAYQRTKAEAELWLHQFAQTQNLPYTVIRPVGIYGPGDRRLLKLFRMASKRVFPLLGYGRRHYYHLVHLDDLVNAILVAATKEEALGQAFLCGATEPIRLPEFARIVGDALGRRPAVLRLPAWPFFLAATLCEAVCRPLHIAPPLYRRRVAFFTKDRLFDTRKMRDVLGYQPLRDNREGLTETALWYREQGWL